jgi:hypothetical protein
MAALGAQLAIGAAGTYTQAQAQRSAARFEERRLEMNARLAAIQAEDARVRGEQAVDVSQASTRRLLGSQRAALAAQGIDVASGSALDVQEATAGLGAMDALTIRNNAVREAWGFRMQELDSRTQARYTRLAGRQEVASTILAGGLGAARDFAAYGARSGAGGRGGAPAAPNTGYSTSGGYRERYT